MWSNLNEPALEDIVILFINDNVLHLSVQNYEHFTNNIYFSANRTVFKCISLHPQNYNT